MVNYLGFKKLDLTRNFITRVLTNAKFLYALCATKGSIGGCCYATNTATLQIYVYAVSYKNNPIFYSLFCLVKLIL